MATGTQQEYHFFKGSVLCGKLKTPGDLNWNEFASKHERNIVAPFQRVSAISNAKKIKQ